MTLRVRPLMPVKVIVTDDRGSTLERRAKVGLKLKQHSVFKVKPFAMFPEGPGTGSKQVRFVT